MFFFQAVRFHSGSSVYDVIIQKKCTNSIGNLSMSNIYRLGKVEKTIHVSLFRD